MTKISNVKRIARESIERIHISLGWKLLTDMLNVIQPILVQIAVPVSLELVANLDIIVIRKF